MNGKLAAALAILLTAAIAHADPNNLDFEGGTNGNLPVGWHGEGAVSVGLIGSNHIVRLDERSEQAESGGLSRIYQDFDPDGATHVSFEFQFVTNERTGKSTVPPDSFTAYLLDPQSKQRVGLPSGVEPDITEGFLYVDSDGRFIYDPNRVTLIGPNGDTNVGPETTGLITAVLNLVGQQVPSNVRLELGFANGNNKIDSFVVLDNVRLGCPPVGCCDAATGEVIFTDDGNPCTYENCVNGVVTTIDFNAVPVEIHDDEDPNVIVGEEDCNECEGCREVDSTDADVVVMFEFSRFISPLQYTDPNGVPTDWRGFRRSAHTLLDFLEDAPTRPRISFGWFRKDNQSSGADPDLVHGLDIPGDPNSLTQDYDALRDRLDGDVFRLNNDGWGSEDFVERYCALGAAIDAARDELAEGSAQRKYIILVTTGLADWPWDPQGGDCDWNSYSGCNCEYAQGVAETRAAAAKAAGIQIFVAHYSGRSFWAPHNPFGCNPNDPMGTVGQTNGDVPEDWLPRMNSAISYLKNSIASTPRHVIKNPDYGARLSPPACQLIQIAEAILCDDGDPCTYDWCEQGECMHADPGCP